TCTGVVSGKASIGSCGHAHRPRQTKNSAAPSTRKRFRRDQSMTAFSIIVARSEAARSGPHVVGRFCKPSITPGRFAKPSHQQTSFIPTEAVLEQLRLQRVTALRHDRLALRDAALDLGTAV